MMQTARKQVPRWAAITTLSCAMTSGVACSPAASPVDGTAAPVVSVRGSRPPAQASSGAADTSPHQKTALRCPPAESRGEGYPPWELRHQFDECISGPEGRWTVSRDTTDAEGWRHFLSFEGMGGERWRLAVISPLAMARRLDGHVLLLDLKDKVSLISPGGSVVWTAAYPDCGAVEALAVGYDDSFSFTCGYSILHYDAKGKLLWQKWPFGNKHMGGPWVDKTGTLFVSGNGKVSALGLDGAALWTVDTGFNRAVGSLVFNLSGNLVFDTGMAARHSDGPIRFYYEHEPNELFEVTPEGAVVSRTRREGQLSKGGWPAVMPVPEDGAHRIR